MQELAGHDNLGSTCDRKRVEGIGAEKALQGYFWMVYGEVEFIAHTASIIVVRLDRR